MDKLNQKRVWKVKNVIYSKSFLSVCAVISLTFFACSCATVDPKKVDVELKETAPVSKITSFTNSLTDLGLMSEIYGSEPLMIQSNPIQDNTGAANYTSGEIPRDITEMIKSSLNRIGGMVVYIPYDPSFVLNQMSMGYSSFDNKVIPEVVLSGGITEFDRALEVRGGSTDFGISKEFKSVPDWLPNKEVSLKNQNAAKTGLARITLDFNLLNFQTLTGIPRMNTVNTMEVGKAKKEKEMAVGLFGLTVGRKGSILRVQGRHDAVRLLVELSMVEIVGKKFGIPYWRVLDIETIPDQVVLSAIKKWYYVLDKPTRVALAQEWLFLHGHDVPLTGDMESTTIEALKQFAGSSVSIEEGIDVETFVDIYLTIPIDEKTLARRNKINKIYEEQALADAEETQEPAPAPAAAEETQQALAATESALEQVPEPARQPAELDTEQQVAAVEETGEPGPAAAEPVPGEPVAASVQPKEPGVVRVSRKKRTTIGSVITDADW
ncbi:MAG: DUF4384 domain-containing protein [Planctomycetes bacterium]|nr:DUF4384 domain-containing protein [Planctomycetota bacterium]